MTLGDRLANLFHQIIHLPIGRSHLDRRIEQSRRTNQLLRWFHTMREFIFTWCRRHINRLIDMLVKFIKPQRSVIQRTRQSKAMLHQHLFACPIAIIHATHLRQRHVALINQQQPIVRKIINQRRRLLARFTICQIARIIFNSLDKSRLAQHLKVVFSTLTQPLRLE